MLRCLVALALIVSVRSQNGVADNDELNLDPVSFGTRIDIVDDDVELNLDPTGPRFSSRIQVTSLDDDSDELNLDPTNPVRQITSSRIQPETQPNCTCVEFYLCKNNTLNTNGEGLLEIRINEKRRHCPKMYYVCCPLVSLIPKENITRTVPEFPSRISGGCGKRNPEGVGFRISGHTHNETQFGEFPWMAAIWMEDDNPPGSNFTVKCGGSLINPSVVLTAAHCVIDKSRHKFLRVRLGEWDIYERGENIKHQDREVKTVVRHENYHSGGLYYDVALLFLKEPVIIADNADTVCLTDADENFDNQRCIVTGWGALSEGGHGQRFLKQLELPIVPNDKCLEALRSTPRLGEEYELHSSFICAGGVGNADTCKGDGGSPLVCQIPGQRLRYQQVGIVSWGLSCGTAGVPGLYANVAMVRKWINDKFREHSIDQSSYTI